MSIKSIASIAALGICLGISAVGPAGAQPATGPTFKDATSQHHQMLNQMMKDMTQESKRPLTAALFFRLRSREVLCVM